MNNLKKGIELIFSTLFLYKTSYFKNGKFIQFSSCSLIRWLIRTSRGDFIRILTRAYFSFPLTIGFKPTKYFALFCLNKLLISKSYG